MKNKSILPIINPRRNVSLSKCLPNWKKNVYLFSLSIPEKMYFLAIFSGCKEGPCERGNLGIVVK